LDTVQASHLMTDGCMGCAHCAVGLAGSSVSYARLVNNSNNNKNVSISTAQNNTASDALTTVPINVFSHWQMSAERRTQSRGSLFQTTAQVTTELRVPSIVLLLRTTTNTKCCRPKTPLPATVNHTILYKTPTIPHSGLCLP